LLFLFLKTHTLNDSVDFHSYFSIPQHINSVDITIKFQMQQILFKLVFLYTEFLHHIQLRAKPNILNSFFKYPLRTVPKNNFMFSKLIFSLLPSCLPC